MTYLRNAWYVAAWSHEVETGALVARTLLDEPVVLFRSGGAVRALADLCPHRFAPLSRGRLRDGVIECGYHGLKFDGAGLCVDSPQTPGEVPARARVRSYRLEERQSLVWIWMGDSALADTATIPDLPQLDMPDVWRVVRGHSHIAGDYRLMIDNLLDLSHPEFLHDGSLGSPSMRTAQYEIRIDSPSVIHSNRWFEKGVIPPLLDRFFPTHGAPVEHWVNMRWQAPANLWLDVGATLAGKPRAEGLCSLAGHLLTPETATTCHYFWSSLRQGPPMSGDERQHAAANLRAIFEGEDEPMIAAVQVRMGDRDLWDMKPVLLPGDQGAVRVRRALDALIAAEGT